LEILRGQGRNYLTKGLPGRITFISDNVTRDINTTQALMEGMDMEANFTIAGAIFAPFQYGVCPLMNDSVHLASVMAAVAQIPAPSTTLRARLQHILGTSKMPPFQEIGYVYLGGYLLGGPFVAGEATEVFILEYGAGVEVGWNQFEIEEIYEMEPLHNYWMGVNFGNLAVAQNVGSNLLAHIMANLTGGSSCVGPDIPEEATVFYIGHDSDMMELGGMLGLEWDLEPYTTNSTVPGSSLRFDLHQDEAGNPFVSINWYATTFGDTDGEMNSIPALFTTGGPANHTGTNMIALQDLEEWVDRRVDHNCVQF
jgi:hypothetical protein